MHDDGSWTVGMQEGTAGGVRQPTFTSFSTPFSPPLISADVYFYFRDDATGLITAVQPVHFRPERKVVDRRPHPNRRPEQIASRDPSEAGRRLSQRQLWRRRAEGGHRLVVMDEVSLRVT